MSPLHIDKISLELFNTTLARYVTTASSTLADLDTLRYETIPAKLAKSKKDTYLLKADVERLVEWKLKHGTFRPTLMNLVKSNSADTIKDTTQLAFAPLNNDADVMRSLKTLTSLRGIGPATASLLLSVYQPDTVPFFSDELFRWTHYDAPGTSGWDRKIKYNVSEYKEMLKRVEGLRKRLNVRAVDTEKVAYVLGKEMADLDGSGGVEEEQATSVDVRVEGKEGVEDAQDESRKRVHEALVEIRREEDRKQSQKFQERAVEEDQQVKKVAKKQGTKRKAKEEMVPAEGARRSTRTKTS
ncbi:hypothetical protein N0V86_006116 [Didymella sp. IMI 355093]|nr:hypothetical protein N0V86_006116 [Didymella sp. IMI 355093]